MMPERGRVLVTGATGFIGNALVPALAGEGWGVRAASRYPERVVASDLVTSVEMPDLTASVDWRGLVDGVDAVVHLAGLAHASAEVDEATYVQINAEATRELAIEADAAGARLVFISSVRAGVGPTSRRRVSADDTPRPVDSYGRSKLQAERHIAHATGNFVVLRPCLVYGPGVKANMAALVRLATARAPLPLATVTARRSILAVENLVSAISFALSDDAVVGRTFVVADPGPALTVGEMIGMMRAAMGRSPGLFAMPQWVTGRVAALAGKGEQWRRITQPLEVDAGPLLRAGWEPVVETADALAGLVQSTSRAS